MSRPKPELDTAPAWRVSPAQVVTGPHCIETVHRMTEHVRNPRGEAADRVGARFDVRVLEPSPPALNTTPYFADDPVAGGEIVPVERPGSRSWADLCAEKADPDLRAWCEDRWLVRHPVEPLPAGFAGTRLTMHALAEHLVAPCRYSASGKIGLRYTFRGFGTPFFADDRQVRIEDGVLFDGPRQQTLTTMREAGKFLEAQAGAPATVYTPSTPLDLDSRLDLDPTAARAVGDWFGFCASLLEQIRAEASDADAPARVQLWPEHFDLAVDLGPPGARSNYGGSPGDDTHDEPYLYVGPHDAVSPGEFWNEPFGASLSYRDILDGVDPLAFLREGKALLTG